MRLNQGLFLLSSITVLTAAGCSPPPAIEPVVQLRAGELRAVVHAPHERLGHYRGARFDWSGMLGQVKLGDAVFWNEWNPSPDPEADHDNAVGPAMEFDMQSPPGFDAAGPGETFVKIGVGVLRRPDAKPYFFRKRYELVDAGTRTTRVSRDGTDVTFVQTVRRVPLGYAYQKRVTLDKSGSLTIACRLTNTGEQPITTEVYAHNFFRLGGQGWMPGTTIRFDQPVGTGEKPRHAIVLDADGRMITLAKPLTPGKSLHVPLVFASSGPPRLYTVAASGLELTQTLDFSPSKLILFGLPETVCVEPFHNISIAPGESHAWSYRFTFRRTPLE